ncbi:MAG: 4-hydroxythreonine-4-phosphate dehydrogenase PdxA [Phycisphaeraceae bacterium]|nr:4-hydroxythreonine-4-phosphate dehydrogenase PdxA [Phycisphaeraceae bacterium]
MPPDRIERPTLALSMGDPGGIGPEVLVKALSNPEISRKVRLRVHGVASSMHQAADRAGIEPFWWSVDRESPLISATLSHDVVLVSAEKRDDPFPARDNRRAGELSFQFVEDAIRDARRAEDDPLRAHAIVTAPISKHAWALAGKAKFPGHTELLASRFGVKRHAMMFVADELRVVLVTGHVPLADLRNRITIGRVFDAIDLGHSACVRQGIGRPRVAVCGLNPHAGEAGLLGDEETRLIEPAIQLATDAGIDARGPFPGDTIFSRAVRGEFDLVVAMYHDQGLIPVKLLAFDRAVNTTLGLPVVRTSPDHGTAFDIAGRNLANPSSMRAAIILAAQLAGSPAPASPHSAT